MCLFPTMLGYSKNFCHIAYVLFSMRVHGRNTVCGMISQYNLDQPEGPKNLMCLVYRRIRMVGFVVFDFCHLYSKFLDMMLIAAFHQRGKDCLHGRRCSCRRPCECPCSSDRNF